MNPADDPAADPAPVIAVIGGHARTAIRAISRHALLPREHRWPCAAAAVSIMPVIRKPAVSLRLSALIGEIHASAAAYPGH